MTTSETTKAADTSLVRDLTRAARYYLGNRRVLLIVAIAALSGGVALNWSWLVAAGIAPILLTALPCLLMCGLGLCGSKLFGGSCASQPSQPGKAELTAQSSVSPQIAAMTDGSSPGTQSCCHDKADTNGLLDHRKYAR